MAKKKRTDRKAKDADDNDAAADMPAGDLGAKAGKAERIEKMGNENKRDESSSFESYSQNLVSAIKMPRLSLNKLRKFRIYLETLKKNVSIRDPKDIEQARILEVKMEKISRRVAQLTFIRSVLYVFLYASLVSSFVAGWGWLQYLTRGIAFFGSLIGSGVLFMMILSLNYVIDSHFSDMHLLASHLIAIYVKHEDEWRPGVLDFIDRAF